MPVALVAAGIGAAGSVASSGASKKGAKKAAQISERNNIANRALAEKLFGQVEGYYKPSMETGNWAQGTINALLGRPGTDQASAQAGLEAFRTSGGYQTAMTEGTRGIAGNRAASGAFLSGATARAMQDRGNYLGQQTLGNYMTGLGNQQAVGEAAKGALTGAATNTTNTIINGNNSNAGNQANAQLARAQAQANLYKDLASIGGNMAGNMMAGGSSYGGGASGAAGGLMGGASVAGPMGTNAAASGYNLWGATPPPSATARLFGS